MTYSRRLCIAWLVLAALVPAVLCGGDHGSSSTASNDTDASSCEAQPLEDYDLGLHIGSVFILLGVSMLGAFSPVLLSIFQHQGIIIAIRCGMTFGFGTILATGFVHMLGASLSYFSNPCLTGAWADYSSWGMVFCLVAIVCMQLFDYIIEIVCVHKATKSTPQPTPPTKVVESQEPDAETGCCSGAPHPHQPPQEYIQQVAVKDLELTGHHFITDVQEVTDPSTVWSFYLVEAGIVMHSILIGLALGVASGSEFVTLLIALSFHQFFEGLAIGAAAVATGLGMCKSLLMGLIYALTTPVGIAIGIGVRSSWNDNNTSTILAQGILDGLAAGILIYVVLVELITPMLTKSSWMRRQHWLVQLLMISSFWSGTAVMAVIGTWA